MSLQHCTSCGNRYEHSHEHRKDCVFYGPSAEGEKLRSGDYGLTGSSPLAAGPADAPTPRTDRETYTISPNDVGFKAISPSLGKLLEREAEDLRRQLATAEHDNTELRQVCNASYNQGWKDGLSAGVKRAEAAEADARELWEALDRNTVGLERIREKHRAKYGSKT